MKRTALLLFSALMLTSLLSAQENYVPSQENLDNREWFQDAKYGLFIHWGVYATMAGGGDMGIAEWIMNSKKIPIVQYEKLPAFFNPTSFDADKWVAMVKDAGMKYITITSKHHDGFAMYDSEVSDYNIVDKTPYGKDILAMLKEACDREGIKLFFYHSQLDWHHPDYYPRGRTGKGYTGRPDSGDFSAYIDYMNAQLEELLTNYGEIGGIWFDGMWDKPDADWRLDVTYALIHKLQPGALIGSNHHKPPYPGEDFMMFERDLPGENTMGFNKTSEVPMHLPLEMCETMNGSWGFNIQDTTYKSVERLVQTMIKAAGHGANFLLNTGPMPNGCIQPENVDTLKAISNWLDIYGETYYGTRRGPVSPQDWGATVIKDNKVYVHVLNPGEGSVELTGYLPKVRKATFFDDSSKVKISVMKGKGGLVLHVPPEKQKPIDTIIVLELR